MKSIVKSLEKNKVLIVTVMTIAGLFYWFQIRPSSIRTNCSRVSIDRAIQLLTDNLQKAYDDCVQNQYYRGCMDEVVALKYQKEHLRYNPTNYNNYFDACVQSMGLK